MYFVFSKLNPVRNVARNAPPVPTIPVMKPEIPPPVIVVLVFAANFSEGLSKNKTENVIKNIPRIICKILCGSIPTRQVPKKLRSMLGIPKCSYHFLIQSVSEEIDSSYISN